MRLAALAPRLGHGVLFAGLHHVHQPERQRVEAQLVGDALHVAFQREEALRHAVAAVGAGGRLVGVDDIGLEADVRLAVGALVRRVERHRLVAGVAGDGQRVVAVGAGVAEHAHLVGHHPPVFHDAGAHADDHRVARGAGHELLFAGVLQLHRPAGGDGQVRADVLDHHLLLVAEPAADARFDDADALDRQPQHRRQDAAGVERHLRAGADHQAVILIPVGDADERLDRRLLHPRHLVLALEDVVGRLQRGVHIAQLDVDMRGQVAQRVAFGERHVVRLVVDHRRARLHALAESRMAGSASYSTSISESARCAISSVSAATAATRSPTKRILRSRLKKSSGPGMGSDWPAVECMTRGTSW